MKVIIAGARDINNYEMVCRAVKLSGFDITEVVCGCASGVDSLGKRWAEEHKIPVREFPAAWSQYGRAAGPIRNGQMADYADALIAIPSKFSTGTHDMIKQAQNKRLLVFVLRKP